jgi:RNA polymerase sigma-70 factor (ECF subfamily)
VYLYLVTDGPHAADLALARACAEGDEAAWERFVASYRPILYRAAAAIDPAGGRELADSIYAELFGLRVRDGERQSLFRYFQGRSSLATWLRAVLAQRHVDRIRAARRTESLPDDEAVAGAASAESPSPEQARYRAALQQTLTAAIAALPPRDRLRLQCYHAQDMALAAIGRMLHEHEGTVSRHLTRTRAAIRADIERALRETHGFDQAQVAECFRVVTEDPGAMDIGKILAPDRSN